MGLLILTLNYTTELVMTQRLEEGDWTLFQSYGEDKKNPNSSQNVFY